MNTLPGYTERLKEDFASFTGKDFVLCPEAVINTANLLAAIDHHWTVCEVNRILDEARSLNIPEAYQVVQHQNHQRRRPA